jgi:pectate lyase
MKTKLDYQLKIIETTAKELGVEVHSVLGKRRFRKLIEAKQIISSLLRDVLGYTYREIGNALIYSSHASAIHSFKMHQVDYVNDILYRNTYKRLLKKIKLEDINIDIKSENVIITNIELRRKLSELQSNLNEEILKGIKLKRELLKIKTSIFYEKKRFAIV